MVRLLRNVFLFLYLLLLTACSGQFNTGTEATQATSKATSKENYISETALLTYQGHASIKIVTLEGKVIFIDPYAGSGYDEKADLVLITHDHYDHSDLSKIAKRSEDFQLFTYNEALENNEHQKFTLDHVTVEAVQAGFNELHDVQECVGYILTLSDGIKIYVSGDTSMTPQMSELKNRSIDYALFCGDGIYNMDINEASEAAKQVQARNSIPYHLSTSDEFNVKKAEQFNVDNRLIIKPMETINLK